MLPGVSPLSGRHALVCGASRGIGRATALELARRGARVTALARTSPELEDLVARLRASGADEPALVATDLDQTHATSQAIDALLARRGPVHVLVNNTGGPPPGPLLRATPDHFVTAFRRHVIAAHEITRRVVPGMTEAGFGRIVNVVSVSVREPLPNLGVSNVVRAAMASWSKTMAMELPPGVTINCVLPGYTETERLVALADETAHSEGTTRDAVIARWTQAIPESRVGRPEEIAAAIAFLASPEASYIRGIALAVDGGRLRAL